MKVKPTSFGTFTGVFGVGACSMALIGAFGSRHTGSIVMWVSMFIVSVGFTLVSNRIDQKPRNGKRR